MAKVKTVTITFDAVDLVGVAKFKVYYNLTAFTELSDGIPYVEIPAKPEQTAYDIVLPTAVPLVDGQWTLAVTAVDEAGNESDMDMMNAFFDFTPPKKPVWRR
jgi:hypothetical protein